MNKFSLNDFQYDKNKKIFLCRCEDGQNFDYSDGKSIEKYILSSIQKTSDITDNSIELANSAKDWVSYYHFGIGRSNIFKVFDFSKKSNVLELGCGCGAITRYLGENYHKVDSVEGSFARAEIARARSRDLDNVKIYCSDIKKLEFDPVYDIVTLIGVLEYAPAYFFEDKSPCLALLKIARSALKPNGILIVAIENKLGIKYWNGSPEDHTGIVYDGINDYPKEKTPVTFSRYELSNLLKSAGFNDCCFNYCFPDYKFATTIFSDSLNKIPQNLYLHNWVETPFPNHNFSPRKNFFEKLAIKTLSQSNIIKEFANSFVVVAGDNCSFKNQWIAKKFSFAPREKKYWCITSLHGDKEKLLIKKHYISDPKRRQSYTWIPGDLLVFDVLKLAIQKKSDARMKEILKKYCSFLIDFYGVGENDNQGFPLLRGDANDAIFRNIIVDKNGGFAPIDDEWKNKNPVPVDYVIYRALSADILPELNKNFINSKNFVIKQIKAIFPQYNANRYSINSILENKFQDSISIKFFKMSPMFSERYIKIILRKIWVKIPIGLRVLFKKILFKLF